MKSQATRVSLLHHGLNVLSVYGLSGVTLGRLAEAARLSKSGLFAHFRSKEQLELALLDEAARLAHTHVVEPAMEAPAGLPRLRVLVERWLGWASRAGLPGGCPVAAALFELDDREGEVRDHVAALEQEWRALLRSLTASAAALGHLRPETDVDQFVWDLCGIYLSHHASARFLRDPAAETRARHAFDALLRRAGAALPS
ncbi:TetR/AcrR family transcriptional regulator [Belnapia rosea]|jgi:AcrR family transcriptional regulator|uniref:Transcriptional regulator, TetR family n=1 Tax=Belnapia rosea TaxID=938405 RepID=A0A1G6TS30_9PROT|nr:TetR/AcrR family transcriptional regulator [Belnapia rosea]SDD31913.1 transcriptional regulator, TetR family [Belnapia rosea]